MYSSSKEHKNANGLSKLSLTEKVETSEEEVILLEKNYAAFVNGELGKNELIKMLF